jgi:enoyl-CoA hydratase
MSASTDCVLLDVQDAIALLALNRPAVLNALDESTYLALDAALADLEVRSDVRAVIVTG